VIEADRVVVDHQQADLHVGDTERLDDVLDRPRRADRHGVLRPAGQIGEVGVAAHGDGPEWRHGGRRSCHRALRPVS
jgi:hypothetical protein